MIICDRNSTIYLTPQQNLRAMPQIRHSYVCKVQKFIEINSLAASWNRGFVTKHIIERMQMTRKPCSGRFFRVRIAFKALKILVEPE
jgi:hypothetical protein